MSDVDREVAVYIALGSNLGGRQENLHRAVRELQNVIVVERISSIWLTEPVGLREQPAFYNAALEARTALGPRPLLDTLLDVERRLGRWRSASTVPMGPRTIDLDLLVYDALSIDEPGIVLPHPRMRGRRFVLAPLAEIAPELRIGAGSPTVRELLEALEPGERVERLDPEGWPPPLA